MKTLFVTLAFAVMCSKSFSQVPSTTYPGGSSTYPNSSMPSSSPVTTPVQPYDGTNPSGQNNVINPEPVQPINTYPNTTPVTPVPAPIVPQTNPTNPGLPNTSSPGVPNTVTPTLPPNNNFNRLFQDPTRTPSEPQRHDPVRTVDGSTGKYKNDHKIRTGKNFASNSHHLKKAKQHDAGKEGSSKEKETPVVR